MAASLPCVFRCTALSTRRKGVEGLSGKRCWLAVRNASLCQFLETSLQRSGIVVTHTKGRNRLRRCLITDR
ncbi:hypothetical protein ACED16_02000 [Enterobacter hormaechei]